MVPPALRKRDLGWWHLMAAQAGFLGGQEPKLAQIGCCSESGRVASGRRDHLGLGVTPCFPIKHGELSR